MKQYIALIALFVIVSMSGCSAFSRTDVPTTSQTGAVDLPVPELAEPNGLRLLSYNVRWGLGTDDVRDLDRIVTQLGHLDADIVVLSEVDVNWRRSGNVDQPRYIRDTANYPYHYYGISLKTWASGNTRMSHYGNLLLSRFPIVSARTEMLPTPAGREPRSALVAQLDVDGTPWVVIGTHLGLNSSERVQQTARLRQIATEAAQQAAHSVGAGREAAHIPVVIMGDFNAPPEAPEITRLLRDDKGSIRFADAHELAGTPPGYTFPFPDPYARIDYVFLSPSLASQTLRSRPVSLPGSDHLPVIVDVIRP